MDLLNSLVPNFSSNSVLILTAVVLLVIYWLREKFQYWSKRGAPSVSPLECLKGLGFLIRRAHVMDLFLKMHYNLDGKKFGGAWMFYHPILIIRDPELIRQCIIKGFSSFHDRNPPINTDSDILGENLFQLTGVKWRQVRYKLSAAFSGVKLKIMFQILKGCAKDLNAYIENLASKTGSAEIDVKTLMSNYTLDVIAACALGIKCNAIADPNCEFARMTKLMFRFNWRRSLALVLELAHPKLPGLVGLKVVDPEIADYLTNIVKNTMAMKDSDQSSSRKDFLQIMMNLRDFEPEEKDEGEGKVSALPQENGGGWAEQKEAVHNESKGPLFSESIILGVIGVFLSAGYEPVSSTLTFALYELAKNPDVQKKMFEEIQSVKAELGNELTYESLKKFKYTEQIIHETLRKRPVSGALFRMCTKPFQMPDSSLIVEKGMRVFIANYALHRDPKYFPDPERFDPDRFSEENIDKIVPGSYLPFGDGPRFCIAMRLAIMDVKTALITVVSNYNILPCAKTPKSIEYYDKSTFTLCADGPVYLRLEKRK